jgi:hypothetical protein
MANLTSITISPSNPYNLVSTTRVFTATAHFSDAPPSDVSLDPTTIWASSDTAVATISNSGGSKGTATTLTISGSTVISATYGGKTGTTVLRVGLANYTRIVEPTVEDVRIGETVGNAAHNPIRRLTVPSISMFTGGITFQNSDGYAGGPAIGYTTVSGHPGNLTRLYTADEAQPDGYWVELDNTTGFVTMTFNPSQRSVGVVSSVAVDVSGNQILGGGTPVVVQIAGEAFVAATGPINAGDFLGPDSNGKIKMVPFNPASPTPILGYALENFEASFIGRVLMRIQICGE